MLKAIRGGYGYHDPGRTADGVDAIELRSSAAHGSAVQVNGGGANLAAPASFAGTTSVLVQLTNEFCFETRYDGVEVGDGGRRLIGR